MRLLLIVLFTLSLGLACDEDAPTMPFPGEVAPCDVSTTDPENGQSTVLEFDPDNALLWEHGPFGVWFTTPTDECSADPEIPFVAEYVQNEETRQYEDVDMYITYPTATEPTVTGDGRVADGKFPVIIFAHANHDRQCNIFRGYWTLFNHWASWGFVVVAVDGTQLNCNRGSKQNLQLRSDGQTKAIEALEDLNADASSRFFGRLDMEKIVYAGHSRGGGASFVSQLGNSRAAGVITLQGVDLTAFGFGQSTLPDFPVLGVTAGEDVDLNFPHVEPTEDQLGGSYTWININGGIHAYTADSSPLEPDDEPLISRQQQHNITEFYTTAFLASLFELPLDQTYTQTVSRDTIDAVLFSHRGQEMVDEQISELGVFVRWRHNDDVKLVIDDFDSVLEGDSGDENDLGGENEFEGFDRAEEVATYRPDREVNSGAYNKARGLLLQGSGTFSSGFPTAPQLDSGDLLQFRMKGITDQPTPASMSVEFETASGRSASVDVGDFMGVENLDDRFTQVSIPISEFEIDGDVLAIRISTSNVVIIDDLRVAASR